MDGDIFTSPVGVKVQRVYTLAAVHVHITIKCLPCQVEANLLCV